VVNFRKVLTMELKKITKERIAKLIRAKERGRTTEGDGLWIEVSPKGKPVWKHQFKIGSKTKSIRLGEYPKMSCKDARAENEKQKKITDRGLAAQSPLDAMSVENLFKKWHERARSPKGKPWSDEYKRNTKYIMDAEVMSQPIAKLRITEILRRDIKNITDDIVDRDLPGLAQEVHKRLNAMFNYACTELEVLDVSPMASMKPVQSYGKRNRYLSLSEIKTFLTTLPGSGISKSNQRALQLMLRTGQRPNEIIEAHEREMDEDWWTIPSERTKNGLEQRVYITETIKELFGAPSKHGWFFPAPKDPEKPQKVADSQQNLKAKLTGEDKRRKDKTCEITIPIKDYFIQYDLRRTCGSQMQKLGIKREVIKAVLNHKEKDVTDDYLWHEYMDERQEAIIRWENKLATIMNNEKTDNVISIAG
jgi:integrase